MKNKLTVLLLLFSSICFSQFGNTWIDYSAPHYTFKITQDGIYRLPYEILANTFPISAVNSADLKIYGKQKQIPIYVRLGNDDVFNAGDYIEFYAEGNDGWLDSLLYDSPNEIGNPDYSLYNDTLLYFLTYNSAPSLRYQVESDLNYSAYTPADFILQEVKQSFNNAYHVGYSVASSYSSYYENGEGWGSNAANGGGNTNGYSFNFAVNTSNVYTGPGAPSPFFQGKSNAVSDASFTGIGNHHLSWSLGNSNYTLYDEVFTGYRSTNVTTTFPVSELNNGNTSLNFNIINDQGAVTDFQAVNFWTLTFPKLPTLGNQPKNEFYVVNNSIQPKIWLNLQNASFTFPVVLVTGDVPKKIVPENNGGAIQLIISNSTNGANQKVVVFEENEIIEIGEIEPVNGSGYFVNYSVLSSESTFIMVYNEQMESSAAQYANYRGSATGGSHNVILAEINELSMQFGGGIPKHALGVRRFVDFIYSSATAKPVGLLLVGKGIREATEPNASSGFGARKSSSAYALNFVPSFGYPSSDIAMTARLDGSNSWAPLLPTGRIAAKNNSELLSYLDKVIEYELAQEQTSMYTKPAKEWQKQLLHFGGGSTSSE